MGWCFGSRRARADPFSDDEDGGFKKKVSSSKMNSSLHFASESLPPSQEVTTVSAQEMEAVLSKGAALSTGGDDWACGVKQVACLDHAEVSINPQPEEHDKTAALAKAYQEQEQLVQALQGQVASWAAKMESVQLAQCDLHSMLASLNQKAGDMGAPKAQNGAQAQKLPDSCLDMEQLREPGAEVAAGQSISDAEKWGVLATLTKRITALESASQRMAASEDGLADLKAQCMRLVPRSEVAHLLETAQISSPKSSSTQPVITDRQQQFYAQIKTKAITAEVLDKVLTEVEPRVESAGEDAAKAWRQAEKTSSGVQRHVEKTSNDIKDLQSSVKQTDKKVEELSKGLVMVANKLHDKLVKLDVGQQQLAERLSALEEKTEDSYSHPSDPLDDRRRLLKAWSDKERAKKDSGTSESCGPPSWPYGPQMGRQGSLARSSSRRQSQAQDQSGHRALPRKASLSEDQFKAVLRRRSQAGDIAGQTGKLPDEELDSFGSSVVLQPPPHTKGSSRASHTRGVPRRKAFTTESASVQQSPFLKAGSRRGSHWGDDDDGPASSEQEVLFARSKGSAFSRTAEGTTTPAQAAYAAPGNKLRRSSGRDRGPPKRMPSSRSLQAASEADALMMRKLD